MVHILLLKIIYNTLVTVDVFEVDDELTHSWTVLWSHQIFTETKTNLATSLLHYLWNRRLSIIEIFRLAGQLSSYLDKHYMKKYKNMKSWDRHSHLCDCNDVSDFLPGTEFDTNIYCHPINYCFRFYDQYFVQEWRKIR